MTKTIGFFFRVYLSRALGAEMMGIYQVAFSVYIVFLGMVSSGIPLTVTAYTARSKIDSALNPHSTVSAAIIINICISVVVVVGALIIRPVLKNIFTDAASVTILTMLLPAVIFNALGDSYKGNIWGQKRYAAVSSIELIEQSLRISLCVLLFVFTGDALLRAKLAAISLSLACAISGFLTMFLYFKIGGKSSSPRGYFGKIFNMSTPITIMRICSALVNFLIAIILPYKLISSGLSNSQAMSVYGSSVGMSLGFLYSPITLTGALAVALVPKLNEEFEAKNYVKMGVSVQKALIFSIITASVFIPLYLTMGNEIGMLFFANTDAGAFLCKAALITLPLTIEHITSSMMNSMGLQYKAFINYIAGILILISCIWFLTPVIGIDSLIIGMAIANSFSTVLHIYQIRKLTSMNWEFLKVLGLNIAFLIPCVALSLGLKSLLLTAPKFLIFVICSSVSVLSIITLNICFGLLDLSAFFTFRKRRSKRIQKA